jgi:hypothetical protein
MRGWVRVRGELRQGQGTTEHEGGQYFQETESGAMVVLLKEAAPLAYGLTVTCVQGGMHDGHGNTQALVCAHVCACLSMVMG